MSVKSNNYYAPGRPQYSTPSDDMWYGRSKSWGDFNGQGGIGFRRSFRASSVSDLGRGRYRVNIGQSMGPSGWCGIAQVGNTRTSWPTPGAGADDEIQLGGQQNNNQFHIFSADVDSGTVGNYDPPYISFVIFSNGTNY